MTAQEFIKQYGWDLAKRDVVCFKAGLSQRQIF